MLLPTGPGPMEAVMSNTFTKTLCRVSRGNLAVLLWVSLAPWAGHAQEKTDESAAELSRRVTELSALVQKLQTRVDELEGKPRLQLPARVHHRISAGQALGGGQCDSAHAMRVELSQHFDGNFPFLRVQQREIGRQVRIEPYIYDTAAHRNHRAEVRKTGFALHSGFRRPNGRMNSCTIGIPRGLGYAAGIAGCGIVSMAAEYSPRRAARLQQAR